MWILKNRPDSPNIAILIYEDLHLGGSSSMKFLIERILFHKDPLLNEDPYIENLLLC